MLGCLCPSAVSRRDMSSHDIQTWTWYHVGTKGKITLGRDIIQLHSEQFTVISTNLLPRAEICIFKNMALIYFDLWFYRHSMIFSKIENDRSFFFSNKQREVVKTNEKSQLRHVWIEMAFIWSENGVMRSWSSRKAVSDSLSVSSKGSRNRWLLAPGHGTRKIEYLFKWGLLFTTSTPFLPCYLIKNQQ